MAITEKGYGSPYWQKPEMWRDEDVPEEYWEQFIKGQKEMRDDDVPRLLKTKRNTITANHKRYNEQKRED